ncbi:hypothetical protein E4T66_08790 [Sinimarinibacterium sp. CAU 1509]|uniref:pilus assembly protein n=1 Tax=Sinimarinibacterium sp. CAU 1509 TaxID=2562283 RepID=UPI0010AC108C|nr:PilC/PilY family type IV pilus protein [Sinimarinibacterium sp. CAU 1509]TJY62302.1 hypothetical protein E4T66_08790 [Sinimarinibacterium sp. CAU 1509]
MHRCSLRLIQQILGAGMLSLVGPAYAALTLSEQPLFLSTGVTPNIMLLFDNSGSMRNMIWDDGYDPATTYPDWSQSCGNGSSACWSSDSTSITPQNFARGNCSYGWTQGRKESHFSSTRKCLKLPAPLGNDTRYYGNYLNYLFETYNNNTNLTVAGTIPQETRIESARSVATTLVTDNSSLRWGLSRFNDPTWQFDRRGNLIGGDGAPGGTVLRSCGSSTADMIGDIAGIQPDTNTPLAETYYEITRYFRGLSSYFNNGTYTSPIQYRCQKNFVLVVTDGFPTWDNQFPNNDPDDAADAAHSLPNWDNRAPTTTSGDFPFFPQYSDGFHGQNGSSLSDEGYTLYLDDLAKFAYDTDMVKTGTDATGVSFNDPSFKFQRLETYAIGFAINNQMLIDAAAYGHGKSYTATNTAQLQNAMQSALTEIASRTSAAASVATNSTRLTVDTAIYQARFITADWSGQLLALRVNLDGTIGQVVWDAAQHIPAYSSREIFTYDPTANVNNRGKTFQWNQLNSSQKTYLNTDSNGTADGAGSSRVDYLRGSRSNEGSSAGQFRVRGNSVLGDIVNSDPAYVGPVDYGFSALPGTEGTAYTSFLSSNAYQARPSVVYVGANDGMLHGFRASDGVELMAYVPNAVFPRLSQLTGQNYNSSHHYLVDGPAKVVDAYLGNQWTSVLVGGLGGGGKSVFALDVGDPDSFSTSDVLWEFSSADDADMGYSYPQPTIARMHNGKWVAIVANGYNSTNEKAVLYVLDLEDGSIIRKFDTHVAGNNGMSSPVPVDVDGDRITDLIYAGDLQGNLWKIDVRDASSSNWGFAYGTTASPDPLYRACSAVTCTAANMQSITARPEVGINPTGGYIVYFGTGRYFAALDNVAGGNTNSFYAIYDTDNGSSPPGDRDDLLQQTVIAEQNVTVDGVSERVRATSNNALTAGAQGWYLDLPASGERQVSTPILRGGSVIFTTLIPNTDACGFGGDSYLMELDAVTGSRLSTTPFDVNHDTAFNESDYITVDGVAIPVSGRRSKEGIIKTPAIISAGAFEVKLASGTTGGIDVTYEPPAGVDAGGRLSWRQVQ